MNVARRKLSLERMESRDCPSATPAPLAPPLDASIPAAISADLANLTAALNTAAADFVNHAQPIVTEVIDAIKVVADTAKTAFDVHAQTHASLGAVIPPLVNVGIDETKLYFNFASGNTAAASTAAADAKNDLTTLGNALTGTDTTGLAATVFNQIETALNNANDTLFGNGSSSPVSSAIAESPALKKTT